MFVSDINGAIISRAHELDDLLNRHLFEVTSPGPPKPSIERAALIEQRDSQ